jgi:hypothetical protein
MEHLSSVTGIQKGALWCFNMKAWMNFTVAGLLAPKKSVNHCHHASRSLTRAIASGKEASLKRLM